METGNKAIGKEVRRKEFHEESQPMLRERIMLGLCCKIYMTAM